MGAAMTNTSVNMAVGYRRHGATLWEGRGKFWGAMAWDVVIGW